LFIDRWKLSRTGSSGGRGAAGAPSPPAGASGPRSRKSGAALYSRHSSALEQFFNYIQGEPDLRLLDLAGASQANISFITGQGYRLYSEDMMRSLDAAFADGNFYENQETPARVDPFLAQSLNFPAGHFDGALLWDVLEFLAPSLLRTVVDRLRATVKPGSYLLAIFHAEERSGAVQTYSYRIADAKTLLISPAGMRQPAQFFNNRSIEKLFQGFEAVKFFLTRDHLREIIVKR
jgi:hypothetical protein